MVQKKNKKMLIKDCYEIFNQEKLSKGVDGVNHQCYLPEIKSFLKQVGFTMDTEVEKINQGIVNQWIINMRNSDLSLGSINHNISSVRVFIYWCMNNGYIGSFKIFLVKGQDEGIKFCTKEEIEKLLVKPDEKNFVECRTYAIICFILGTGSRISTLINIKLSDINFQTRLITYRHLKNKHIATVPISQQLEKVLRNYINSWDTGSEWLFCNIGGGQLTVGSVEQSLSRYCKKRGVSRKGPHSLRHTFSREWILNGGNVFALQQMLTHSDLNMTKRYVKLFSNDILNSNFEMYTPLDNLKRNNSRTKTVKRNT